MLLDGDQWHNAAGEAGSRAWFAREERHRRDEHLLSALSGVGDDAGECGVVRHKNGVGIVGSHVDDTAHNGGCIGIACVDGLQQRRHVRHHLVHRVPVANVVCAKMDQDEVRIQGQPMARDVVDLRNGPAGMPCGKKVTRS